MEEEKIKALWEAGRQEEAIRMLQDWLAENGQDEQGLLWLGELIYATGRLSEALNKFNAVLRLNPENRKARNYVAMINSLLGYSCTDLLNP